MLACPACHWVTAARHPGTQRQRVPCSPVASLLPDDAMRQLSMGALGGSLHKQSVGNYLEHPLVPAPHTHALPHAGSARLRSRLTQCDTLESSPDGLASLETPDFHRPGNVSYLLSCTILLPAIS